MATRSELAALFADYTAHGFGNSLTLRIILGRTQR